MIVARRSLAAIIDPLRRVLKHSRQLSATLAERAAIIDPLRRVLKLLDTARIVELLAAAIIDPLRRVLKHVQKITGQRPPQAAIIDPLRRVLKLNNPTGRPAEDSLLQSSTRCEGY